MRARAGRDRSSSDQRVARPSEARTSRAPGAPGVGELAERAARPGPAVPFMRDHVLASWPVPASRPRCCRRPRSGPRPLRRPPRPPPAPRRACCAAPRGASSTASAGPRRRRRRSAVDRAAARPRAASGPWPEPVHHQRCARRAAGGRTAQASPRLVSPGLGRHTAPTRARTVAAAAPRPDPREHARCPGRARSRCRTSVDSRRIAPRPVPGVPAVEWPSSQRRAPRRRCPARGRARGSRRRAVGRVAGDGSAARRRRACLTRLVAASVATQARAARPRVSSRPSAGWQARGRAAGLADLARVARRPRAVGCRPTAAIGHYFQRTAVIARALARAARRSSNSLIRRLRAAQAQPQAACRSCSRPCSASCDVGDARALVLEGQAQPAARPVVAATSRRTCPPPP